MSIADEFEAYLDRYNEVADSPAGRASGVARYVKSWPADPNGSLVPILEASVEAAKARHPSGKEIGTTMHESIEQTLPDSGVLTAADRCDAACGAAAVYQVTSPDIGPASGLLYCLHHWRKHFPKMSEKGWKVTGANPELAAALGGEGK